jgi:hypothetical protein
MRLPPVEVDLNMAPPNLGAQPPPEVDQNMPQQPQDLEAVVELNQQPQWDDEEDEDQDGFVFY